MNCPHCGEPLNLAAIPDAELKSERARRNSARRKVHAGRIPPITCECGQCPKCKRRDAMRRYRAARKEKGTKMRYRLYSSAVRSRLEIRAPYLEAASDDLIRLKSFGIWRFQPCVITDENGVLVEDNGVL